MSLDTSVRLSSKKTAIGQPFEDLYKLYTQKEQLPIDVLENLLGEVQFSAQNADSGHERQRIEQLRPLLEQFINQRNRIRNKPRLSQYEEEIPYEDFFNPGDYVMLNKDLAANDGSLISAGSVGKILRKYKTDKANLVYLINVNNRQLSTFSENIRMAVRLSTAGEDPSAFDSSTDCPSGAQISTGGDTVRTHSPLSLHQEKDEREAKWIFDPKTKEWLKVFDKVAKLINGQINPTPASVSPFYSQLQDLSINYQSNPQGTFNAQQVSDTLNNTILTQDEQNKITEKQNQTEEEKLQNQDQQQKTGSSADVINETSLDRSQLEGDDEGRFKTNIDIDGPNQSHQIQTKNKDDDDVFDWLPSPYDQGEDGNYKVNEGPKFWL